MRWQAILLGVVASWAFAAQAANMGASVEAHRDTGSEILLPWIDWEFEVGTSLLETIPLYHALLDLHGETLVDISNLTRFDPWYDIPELDR